MYKKQEGEKNFQTDGAMARGSCIVWIPFLFSFVCQASDSRHVNHEAVRYSSRPANPDLDDVLSKYRIILPEGIDPKNVNVTSIVLKSCTGLEQQLAYVNSQLQWTIQRNSQLYKEASGLRGNVQILHEQLKTCFSSASDVADCEPSTVTYVFNPRTPHQTQLLNEMNQLLGTLDSDTFLIMQVIALTREVNSLEREVKNAPNGTETHHIKALQEKTAELRRKTQEMERSHINAPLILQIISLQNLIWDLDPAGSVRGNLQEQLDWKISELRGKGDANSAGLELISVDSKIAGNLVDVLIEQSRTRSADYQRQLREKDELLKKKISLLNCDNSNTELPKEITILQNEVEHFRQLIMNNKNTTDSQVKEQRIILEGEKKRLENLQKQLRAKYPQAQSLIKIISIMKELRELERGEENQTTSTSQTTTLQTQLQAKEEELAKAQAEMHELQRKLELGRGECSSLEERHREVQAELEQKLAELNRNGDAKAALVLNVIYLYDALKTLNERISTTTDPNQLSELQRQLETKQDELNDKTAEVNRLIPNPKTILLIIQLQNEIRDLDKNETTGGRVEELQSRVDGLIGQLEVDSTTMMLKIQTLQSQVERLQTQLSDLQKLQTAQVTQLRNDLAAKKDELQKYQSDLNKKNEKNAQLLLTIDNLQNQLRKLEKERQTLTANIRVEEQQKAKEERSRDQAEIKALKKQLNQTEAQCSSFESKIIDVQKELDEKMRQLQSNSESSLALQISTLNLQLDELKRRLQNTESETTIKEIQALLEEKTNELNKKKAELKATSPQAQRIIQIIAIHTEIEKWMNVGENETSDIRIQAFEDQSNYLIDGIKGNENTKLMLKMLAQQDLIARLKIQEKRQIEAAQQRIKDLEDELERVRNLIKEKTLLLGQKGPRIDDLSTQIVELNKKIKPLEDEISDIKETSAENIRELQERLNLTQSQLQDTEVLFKQADEENFNSISEIADLRKQLKEAEKKASKAAGKNIDELEQRLETGQREIKRLENTNKDLEQEVKELKTCCTNNVNTHCDDLRRQLQQSQEDAYRLQQQLREKDATLKQLQQELEDQTQKNNRQQQKYSDLEQQLQQSQVNADVLQQQLNVKDAVLDQLQKELEEQTRKNNKLQDDYDSLQNTKDQLQNRVQDLQNNLHKVEYNIISHSMINFDPNTAHPRIALSAQNTEISTSEEIQNVLDNPGRFNVHIAILGTYGYSSGRHFWEVSVVDIPCYHIGMASASSQRKGSIQFRPANGFWTIILNKRGQYTALDTRSVAIPNHTLPLTLGILLDYEKGLISFYDTGRRSHIYTFQHERFTDKIYPFINVCVEDSENKNPIVSFFPGSTDWIQ